MHMEPQYTPNYQNNLEKKNESTRGFTSPRFRLYYKTTVF